MPGLMAMSTGCHFDLREVARYAAKVNAETPRDQDKFRAYRARKKAAGLREVRLWLPDANSAEFKAQMARIEQELRMSKDERDFALHIDAALDEALQDIPPL